MNFLQTACCRVFQTVLRLALPFLPYRSPKVIHSVQEVPNILHEQGIGQVLIVTDGFLHLSGMLEPLKSALTRNGVGYTVI